MQASLTHLLAPDLVDFDPQILVRAVEAHGWTTVATYDSNMVAYQRPGGRDSVLDMIMFSPQCSAHETHLALLAQAMICFAQVQRMTLLETLCFFDLIPDGPV